MAKNKPNFSSYAFKKDPSGKINNHPERHDPEKTALLDNPGSFLQDPAHYSADVDKSAKNLNESLFAHPISGDDIAKMGNKRINSDSAAPILKSWVDVPQDRAHYEQRKFSTADQQAESTNPSKGM